jgi:glycosyltransferase involved in cell wall biosynthesis
VRILFTRFPLESTLGGAEIQTLSLMEGLMERGHAVAFAGSCPVLLAECRKRQMPVAEVHIGPPPVTKWGAVSFAWRKQGMRNILRTLIGTADVIVMLSLSEKLLLTDIAADAGSKVIWIEHDRIGRWLTQNPWLPLLKKQSGKATTVVVSELSRKMYADLGWDAERVIAIPNGVTSPTPQPLPPRGEGGLLRLGCIARLSHEKGVDVLIDAMAAIPDTATLEIIGTGREETALKALTRRLDLQERITFTPHEPDIGGAYARFDALVLPSRDHDPFGMVAAEAMLAGLPVIVTDRCGIAGYLESEKDALIVKADSPSALADAIKRLGVRSQEIGVHGQKTAQKKFSVKSMVEKYEDVFTGSSSRD